MALNLQKYMALLVLMLIPLHGGSSSLIELYFHSEIISF